LLEDCTQGIITLANKMDSLREREEYLTHQDRLRIKFVVERGRVNRIDLVQYEAEIHGQWWAVVRYDMAHGYFHRDVVKPDGMVAEKLVIPYRELGEALTMALEELHRQWPFYRRQFEEWMK
jgi:hypothetical protein